MTSYGLDTSVVLRLLVGVPVDQARVAIDFLEECNKNQVKVYVSDLVVFETYHALCHHYDVPVEEAVGSLADFLASEMVESAGIALSVLREYTGAGAGLADRLILKDYMNHVSTVVTFDKKFAKLDKMKKL